MDEHDDDADTGGHDERAATPPIAPAVSWTPHVDAAGAALVVIGCLGVAAWAWALVRGQFDLGSETSFLFGGGEGSVSHRIDGLANQLPVLMFAGLVGGLGIALRAFALSHDAGDRPPGNPIFGRPFGRLLLGTAGAIALVLVAAALLDGDEDDELDGFDFGRAGDDVGRDVADELVVSTTTTALSPAAPTHSLEVHTDGCGVIRTGELGDDLTWVVKDQDGFQVLGRNAAGETQYRYYQPGTYTVVLEGWNGDYYAEVSNEVTISC